METWNVFHGSDLLIGLIGAAGFLSVFAVLFSASSNVNKREINLQERMRQAISDMEPEERVLLDPMTADFDHPITEDEVINNLIFVSDELNKKTDDDASYDTSSK